MNTKDKTSFKEYFVGKPSSYLSVLCASFVYFVTHLPLIRYGHKEHNGTRDGHKEHFS